MISFWSSPSFRLTQNKGKFGQREHLLSYTSYPSQKKQPQPRNSRESSESTDRSAGPLALKPGSQAVFVLQEEKSAVRKKVCFLPGQKDLLQTHPLKLHDKHRGTSKLKQKGKGIQGLSRSFFLLKLLVRRKLPLHCRLEETGVCVLLIIFLFLPLTTSLRC